MSLEHQDERRLTDQERDRILDLAERLQDQHQATTSLEEVERTAEEAGIDPRFVRQAAAQPGLYGAQAPAEAEESQGEIGPRVRYGLALFAAGCLPGMPFVQQHFTHFVVLLGIAAVAALGGHALGRRGEKTWIPLTLGVVAFFLGIQALGLVLAQGGGFYRYEPSLALFVLVALAAAGGGAWGRRTRRSARLNRTQRPR